MNFQCLLFDLDGTLIDSRADLIKSINLMLRELACEPLADSQVIGFVGEGIRLLVERSLRASQSREPDEAQILAALQIFSHQYQEHLLDQTHVYPEVLTTLEALHHWPKAIVTNKPFHFTQTILAGLGLTPYFKAVIGGDSTPARKPSPLPLLEAARRCEIRPENCLMIGDTRIDILAGQAAGMKTCGYVGGFRGKDELVQAGASFLIENFGELPELLAGV